jgi:hypothetical protein
MHREADRVFRGQGNNSGRTRCRTDGTIRSTRAPRGVIVSTGEDTPRGESLRSRMMVLEVSPGEVDLAKLTVLQGKAADGLLAGALSAFVAWLAPQYGEVYGGLKAETVGYRDRVLTELKAEGTHGRTPDIAAGLVAGWRWFLDFAVDVGVIDREERERLARRAWDAIKAAAAAQAESLASAEPASQFLRLLSAALASGQAHLAGLDDLDGPPSVESAGGKKELLGWRQVTTGTGDYQESEWQSRGKLIGWADKDGVYLEPESAYAEAQKMAREQGESLPVTLRTLGKRLRERGLLVAWDKDRQRNTVRKTLGELVSREVLHLRIDTLITHEKPSKPSNSPQLPPQRGGE